MKFMLSLTILTVAAVMVSADVGGACDNCVWHDKCDLVDGLDAKVLKAWSHLYPCNELQSAGRIVPVLTGTYVCCSESLLSKYLEDLDDIIS